MVIKLAWALVVKVIIYIYILASCEKISMFAQGSRQKRNAISVLCTFLFSCVSAFLRRLT